MEFTQNFLTLESSLLYIAILATIFFFGEHISKKIKDYAKSQSKNVIGAFGIMLILILILSAIPLVLAQLITEFFPNFTWGIIIILIIANFIKYLSEN